MRTAVFINVLILIIAAFALAQVVPPAPVVPASPARPVAPAVADVPSPAATPSVPAVPSVPAMPVYQIAQETPPTPSTPATPATPPTPPTPPTPARSSGSYLGINPDDVTPESMGRLKLSQARGVEIDTVDQDSPAGKAGLRQHDVILSFNGQAVNNSSDLRRFIRRTSPGQNVTLGISRDGQMQNVQVQLANRENAFNFHFEPLHIPPINIPEPPIVNMLQRRNGLTLESVSGQLAQYFGCKNGHCVLVRSVDRGSNAEAAGFKAGDVIVATGNSSVDNVADLNRAFHQGGKVNVKVLRDRREQTLTFNVPDRSRSDASTFQSPDFSGLQQQLAELRPQIERETQRAQEEMQRAMELHRKELENFNSEWVKAEMERLKPQMEREIARAQREAQRAMELKQKDLQKQMEQMRKELEKSLQDLKTQQQDYQNQSQ
ncbi:MAG TPA: PDZ domain-containing protein [Terriglobales bacterium]|nr:PDZ domain-containing protein [Terriglobales bacterium]